MKIVSHIQVASMLVNKLNQSDKYSLNKYAYRIGAIIPDISPHLRFLSHHFNRKHSKISIYKRKIDRTKSSIRLSYVLGKISHFVADSFCIVHNKNLGTKIYVHKRYETLLYKYIKSNLYNTDNQFLESQVKINNICMFLHEHLNKYLNTQNHEILSNDNLYNDLSYIVHVNLQIAHSLIKQFELKSNNLRILEKQAI